MTGFNRIRLIVLHLGGGFLASLFYCPEFIFLFAQQVDFLLVDQLPILLICGISKLNSDFNQPSFSNPGYQFKSGIADYFFK
jgi:hypothetical protein